MPKHLLLQAIADSASELDANAADMSIVELEAFQGRLSVLQAELNQCFLGHQQTVLQMLRQRVKSHMQLQVKYAKDMKAYTDYFTSVNERLQQMDSADGFFAIEKNMDDFIRHCEEAEKQLFSPSQKLSVELLKLKQALRVQGLLPRDFTRDVLPLVSHAIMQAKQNVRAKSAIVAWNGQLFQRMQDKLTVDTASEGEFSSAIQSEVQLAAFLSDIVSLLLGADLAKLMPETQSVMSDVAKKLQQVGFSEELRFVGLLGSATRKVTAEALVQLRSAMQNQGLLQPSIANDWQQKHTMLQDLFILSDLHLQRRKSSVREQFISLKQAHYQAIEKYIKPNAYAKKVRAWWGKISQAVDDLFAQDAPENEASMLHLQKKYQNFWVNIIIKLDQLANDAQQSRTLYASRSESDYLKLRDNAYRAVSYLKHRAGVITVEFKDFDIKYIIKEMHVALAKNYRFSLFSCGHKRKKQWIQLEARLQQYGVNPMAVGKIILQEITSIDADHAKHSTAYNFSFWRRPSRSVIALSEFLNQCMQRGWAVLPENNKILLLEKTLQTQINSYFDQFFLGSLVQRGVVAKILDAIYEVKLRLLSDTNYTQWQGMQQIASALALVLQQEKARHEQKWTTKLLRFFGCNAESEFVQHLQSTQYCVQQQAGLPQSFAVEVLPVITAALEQLRSDFYKIREDNSWVNKLTNFNSDKQQAMIDISVLIKHLQEQCVDVAGATLAVSQLLDKFENDQHYSNKVFYKQMALVVKNLEIHGHLAARNDLLGEHLEGIQNGLQALHAGVEVLRP